MSYRLRFRYFMRCLAERQRDGEICLRDGKTKASEAKVGSLLTNLASHLGGIVLASVEGHADDGKRGPVKRALNERMRDTSAPDVPMESSRRSIFLFTHRIIRKPLRTFRSDAVAEKFDGNAEATGLMSDVYSAAKEAQATLPEENVMLYRSLSCIENVLARGRRVSRHGQKIRTTRTAGKHQTAN
jgi:hypothetical protein